MAFSDCRYSKSSKILRWSALFLYLPVALGLMVVVVIVAIDWVLTGDAATGNWFLCLMAVILPAAMSLFWLYFSVVSYRFESRKYRTLPEGLQVLSGKQIKTIPWCDVRSVNISILNGNGGLNSYEKVIICVTSAEDVNFQSNKIMRGYLYCAKSPDKFIVIDYADKIVEKFREYYPNAIIDHVEQQLKHGLGEGKVRS